MTARVHVLLPVHNRRRVTEGFIRCLMAQSWRNFHLVLIDDGSGDGTAEMVLGYLPGATVLRGSGDWWWAGSLQQGIRHLVRAGAGIDDVVLIANDDTVIEPDFIENAVAELQRRPRSLLLARLFNARTGGYVEAGVHADWRALRFIGVMEADLINCFATRGLFLRMADMLEIGGFHPFLLPHYASDYEFTIRAHRKGFALVSPPALKLWFNDATTGIRHPEKQTLTSYLRSAISRRSTLNPFYWTTFVLLACPIRYVPINLARVWFRFLVRTLHAVA